MAFIDVHAHLDDNSFVNDLDDVIFRAKDSNVVAVICNGLNLENNKKILGLAKKYDIIKAALGLYPTDAVELTEEQILETIDFIKKNKDDIISVGEVGLDYHWIKDKDKQKREKDIFLKMIELSEKIKKPLSVHSRGAEKDTIEILETSSSKKIHMHCFGGNKKMVLKCADNGWFFSIPANIVFSTHFQQIVEEVNINQLLTETDSPYLGPDKGVRNEPANVVGSIKKIAELKKMDVKETENNIYANYQKLFL